MAVIPVWGDHFRVNGVTGADPTAVRIRYNFFLAADTRVNVIEAAPPITPLYSPRLRSLRT